MYSQLWMYLCYVDVDFHTVLCLPLHTAMLYELFQMYSSIYTHILNPGTVNICFLCQT